MHHASANDSTPWALIACTPRHADWLQQELKYYVLVLSLVRWHCWYWFYQSWHDKNTLLVDWYLIRQHDTNIETLQWTVQARLVQISHWGLHQTDTLETPKVSNMVQQVGWTHKSNQSDLQAEVPCRHQAALLIGQRDVTNIWFNCGMRAWCLWHWGIKCGIIIGSGLILNHFNLGNFSEGGCCSLEEFHEQSAFEVRGHRQCLQHPDSIDEVDLWQCRLP